MKVICSNIKCEYCNAKNVCQLKEITLVLNGIHTLNQGYQDYLKCKNYKKSKIYEEIEKSVEEILGDKENE